MAIEYPAEDAVPIPVPVPAEVRAALPAVAAGGGFLGRMTSFIWAPFRFLTGPIAYLAERFWPGVFSYIKDRYNNSVNKITLKLL